MQKKTAQAVRCDVAVLGGGVSVAEAFGDTAAPQPASSAITMDALPF